jgi:glutamate formiminotransferase / 5-formyltetrahydrofolate cyclo-ligase
VELIECVPNFSEGRRSEVVDACARAVRAVPEVRLLDRTSDPDHDRSVLTFAGPPDAVMAAARALAVQVVARIDMRRQHGRHPRVGALDVVPFVPVGETSMETCVALAEAFGVWFADRYQAPVYLYAKAARRPERVVLADIRRPGFEGLAAALGEPAGEPDMGPPRPHPTAGATVTGARPFLVAWNIQLASGDLSLARDIAHHVRERDGGLPAVQALGISLESLGCVQVSLNLLDASRTPMWQVLERVTALADSAGVPVIDTELIGLAPLNALLDVADHAGIRRDLGARDRVEAAARWLRLRDPIPEMAFEIKWSGSA